MKNVLVKALAVLSAISSILGFFAIFLCDIKSFAIAIVIYAVAITAFFVAAYLQLIRSLAFRNNGAYRRVAALQTFTCDDNKIARFETRKIIQSKSPFLSEVEFKSKWQGKGEPEFKVNGIPVKYRTSGNPDEFESFTVKLGRVLAYNETSCYTTTNECPYSDYKPRFGCRVDEPTDFIQFRILLGKKSSKPKPAVIYKRSIKAGRVGEDQVFCKVDFDSLHKVYFKVIENPEIGYLYFITWEK